jgi:hypothetical protein
MLVGDHASALCTVPGVHVSRSEMTLSLVLLLDYWWRSLHRFSWRQYAMVLKISTDKDFIEEDISSLLVEIPLCATIQDSIRDFHCDRNSL